VEADVRLDYASQPVALHDRFLLCSDGVHGFLSDQSIADILRERSAPEDTAGALVATALRSGSTDNCTALVPDVIALPTGGSADNSRHSGLYGARNGQIRQSSAAKRHWDHWQLQDGGSDRRRTVSPPN
jgi:serine/threonine protein phosphatase PrpC